MKKTIIGILLIVGVCTAKAQNKPEPNIKVSLFQDSKLLFTGDDKGNEAGTLNILTRVKLYGRPTNGFRIVVFPEFEYAKLKGGDYRRWSINLGLSKEIGIFNIETNIGWGFIDRDLTYFSWGQSNEISVRITKRIDLSALLQFTDRSDLYYYYGESMSLERIRMSTFIGLTFKIL